MKARNTTAAIATIAASLLLGASAHAETINAVVNVKQNVSMQDLAKSVTDPASSRFGKPYSNDEIRALAGPTDAEYASLKASLVQKGLVITSESPTHLWIGVKGDRAAIAALGQRAKAGFASLDFSATRSVESVHGLNAGPKRRPHLVRLAKGAKADFNGNTPAVIHTFYGFDAIYAAGLTGKGQHISIATYDDLNLDDVTHYYADNNVSPAPAVDKVTFNGTPQTNNDSADESEVDAEFSGMTAPGAQIHVFTSSDNSDAGELAMFTAILDDGRAKVVNYSWGSCEDQLDPAHKTAMDAVFSRAVAQGVNILVASGDSGSDCDGDGSNAAGFPASSPNVVAVGGTTIPDGAKGAELAWSGSGGGISKEYTTVPAYQAGLGAAFSAGRAYPDVAFNADPDSGQPAWIPDPNSGSTDYVVIGGTSIAAPQWSGFLALVGEARGATALGQLNPILYKLNSTSAYAKLFNDITSGSNGEYTAGTGFDAVTGWGSPQADALLNALKAN